MTVFAITTALTIYGADGRGEVAFVLSLITVTVLGVYGVLLPRMVDRPKREGVALLLSGIAIVVLLPAFWSGESLLLGVAGAWLGWYRPVRTDGATPGRSKKAVTAMIVGVVASVGYLAVYALDAVLPPSGG